MAVTKKKAQTGTKVADSTAWKNRTFSTYNNQGLTAKRNELSKLITPTDGSPVVRQKVDMINRELTKRRGTVPTKVNSSVKPMKCGGKVKSKKK